MHFRSLGLLLLMLALVACHRKETGDAEKDRSSERHHEAERPVTDPTPTATVTPAAPTPSTDSTIVHSVPIGKSPVLGKNEALVTLVAFDDFECPFCKKAQPTIAALRGQYGDELRVVWKNFILANHTHAKPAAELAYEARDEKGDAMFWLVHDDLFSLSQAELELGDSTLLLIAGKRSLDQARVTSVIASSKHKPLFDEDAALAKKLGVSGAPTFFINGHVIVGAQSIDTFRAIVEPELASAKARVVAGTSPAKVYAAMMSEASDVPIR